MYMIQFTFFAGQSGKLQIMICNTKKKLLPFLLKIIEYFPYMGTICICTCIYKQYLYQSGTTICHQTHKYFVWLVENNGTVKTVQ